MHINFIQYNTNLEFSFFPQFTLIKKDTIVIFFIFILFTLIKLIYIFNIINIFFNNERRAIVNVN